MLIDYCTGSQITDLFHNFYPTSSLSEAENFVNRLKDQNLSTSISPAVLQGHFLMYKNEPDAATKNAGEIIHLLPRSVKKLKQI